MGALAVFGAPAVDEAVRTIKVEMPDDVRTTVQTTTTTTTITTAQRAGRKEKDEDVMIGKDKRGNRIPCGNMTRCDSCTIFDSCVWCPHENKCVAGGPKGPLAKAKSKCTGRFDHFSCQNEPCEYFNTCGACVRIPICGWCAETAQCLSMLPNGNEQSVPDGEAPCTALLRDQCSISDAQQEDLIDLTIAQMQ